MYALRLQRGCVIVCVIDVDEVDIVVGAVGHSEVAIAALLIGFQSNDVHIRSFNLRAQIQTSPHVFLARPTRIRGEDHDFSRWCQTCSYDAQPGSITLHLLRQPKHPLIRQLLCPCTRREQSSSSQGLRLSSKLLHYLFLGGFQLFCYR